MGITMTLQELEAIRPETIPQAEWFGLDAYPLFNNLYRVGLNKKILDHYWFQEIGYETQEQFEFVMRRKMNEIMPPYNQLYLSSQMTFDPFKTVNIVTVATGNGTSTTSAHNDGTNHVEALNKSRSVGSDTPQTMLSDDEDYASNASDVQATVTTDGNTADNASSSTDSDNESESTTSGYQGNPSDMLNAYRSTILNIDLQIINELPSLFLGIWGNSDMITPRLERGYYPL